MASHSMDDFVGNGALKELLPKLLEEGWDDVPTLKIMNSEDMEAINMTQLQKNAMEIRKYLHDRSLTHYGDTLEASGKCLPELLGMSPTDLSSQYGMKRGHIARFVDRTIGCVAVDPGRKMTTAYSRKDSSFEVLESVKSINRRSLSRPPMIEQSLASFKIKDGYVFKGIVAAEPQACGCGEAPPPAAVDKVAPYSVVENISIQKLTAEFKIGMECSVKAKTPSVKASDLWRDKPAVLLCIRRPGCIMCRAEAYQLYAKKPIFDALGVQLFAVLHEHIVSEVTDFWPQYWGGEVLFDREMGFFKALGGGQVLKEKFVSGFMFNLKAIANYRRAKAMGMKQNLRGEGEIKGGLFIMGKGKSGIAYQFIERNFGDRAPLAEVIEICTQLQNKQDKEESIKMSQEMQ